MLQFTQRFIKSYSFLWSLSVLLLLTACSSGDSTLTTQTEDKSGIPVPGVVSAALPQNGTLSAYIRVDDGPRQDMTITDGMASITLNGLALGEHTVTMEFEFLFDDNPDQPLMLASASKVINVGAGQNTLDFAETEYDSDSFDADSDGIPNLTELSNNTSPFAGISVSPLSGNTAEDGTTATFTVTLTGQPQQGIDVSVSIASSDTSEGSVSPATLTFDSSNWNTPQEVIVTGVDDSIIDGDQTYSIDFASAVSADSDFNGLQPASLSITNVDDDGNDNTTPVVSLSIDNPTIAEAGGVATVTATLNQTTTQSVTVTLSASANSTASATDDYTYDNSITISAGSLTGTTTVTAQQDTLDENDETVVIGIDNVTNGSSSGDQVTTTIADDDQPPEVTLSINTSTPLAEAGGSANITASLSTASGLPVTVNLLYSGNATPETDYSKSDSIVIPAGTTFEQTTVTAVADTIYEGDETIFVDIDTVANGVEISAQQVTVSIADDDLVPLAEFSTGSQTVSENAGLVALTLVLDHASAFDVVLPYSVSGTATAADHDLTNGVVNIAAGETSGSTSFTIVDDTQVETDETVVVTLGNPTNADLGTVTTHIVTIYDNDLTVGGTVSGLAGTLVLQNNGGDDTLIDADGIFTFTATVPLDSTYNATVKTQPSGQQCSILQGSGIANDNITTIDVQCFTAAVLNTNPFNQSVVLNWNDTGAVSYDLYYSTDPNCDVDFINACPDGMFDENVTAPYEVTGLTNGQYYGFWLVSNYPSGHATRSASGARPDRLMANWFVRGVAADTNGTTYIGGEFTHIGSNSGGGIPFRTDSVGVYPFPPVIGNVDAVVSDGSGGWYIGGSFNQVGGISRNNIAHILSDGSVSDWNPDANDRIIAIAVGGSNVYLAGYFTSIGGATRFGFAAIDTNGDATSLSLVADNSILTIAVSGSIVYVGGAFTQVNGVAHNHLAAVDINTGNVLDWNLDADNSVSDLAANDSTVYVAGGFTSMGGMLRNHLASIDSTTGVVNEWNPDADDWVNVIAERDGIVYAGGAFTSIGGATRYYLAALDGNGSATNWNPEATANGISAIAVSSEAIYVGGYSTTFTTNDGVSRNYLVSFDKNGNITDWDPVLQATNSPYSVSVNALAISGPAVYVGGTFTMIGGAPRNRLAAFDSSGNLTDWDPGADGLVSTLTVSGSTIYAGGWFSNVGGVARQYFAAIDTSGAATSWSPNPNGAVDTIKISGSTVYVGGRFTSIGGVARNRLASLDAAGNVTSWNPDANDNVVALAIDGGTVYVGGVFTNIGGALRNYIAAIDMSGVATAWDPNASRAVYDLEVSGSTIYACGSFTNIGGATRNHIAALDASGIATSWNPNANGIVYSLAVNGPMVYAGGDFTYIGTTPRSRLAEWDAAGDLTTWNPAVNDLVFSVVPSGSTVIVGGDFTSIDGYSAQYFSIISP